MTRLAAITFVTVYYNTIRLVSGLVGRRSPAPSTNRMMVIGTFHNEGWFFSHIRPLTQAGFDEIVVVCDAPMAADPRIRYVTPRRLRWLGRPLARLLLTFWSSYRYRPAIYMGFHIFPAGALALLLGRLRGRPVVYQVTSGPLQLEGGGWQTENRVLRRMAGPSPAAERAAHGVAARFDIIVVRGAAAVAYFREFVPDSTRILVVTGSVAQPPDNPARDARDIDVMFVGRLSEIKQPHRLVEVASQVCAARPGTTFAFVGDGPEREALEAQCRELGIDGAVQFVGQVPSAAPWLPRARCFLLTSRSEGVSIAMLEAMGAGVVPVVSDVGDLKDFVTTGDNGCLVRQDDIDGYATALLALLGDAARWEAASAAAWRTIHDRATEAAIAGLWRAELPACLGDIEPWSDQP